MSEHTTLYRKWRPIDFSSVVGQDHITSVLKYQVANNRTSHAYLFCGSRGTGKTTCAKILSKAINCLSPKDGNPCGDCECCRLIESGADTDIIEMDAASNNGVDYIRDIREEVVYMPAALKKRVYIIDEVHMLSTGAFNALLKTLEEPPSHVVFILATTELQKLPATITSRCQRFDFKRISTDDIAGRLEYIASKENISITHEAAKLIGRISLGGMRDSISLLELCSSKGKSVNISLVNETAGTVDRRIASDTVKAILTRDIPAVFEIIQNIYERSSDILNFFAELIGFYRDMLVVKSMQNADAYLDLTGEEMSVTVDLAERFTKEKLLYHIRSLEDSYVSLSRGNSVNRVSAEMALIVLTDDRISESSSAILSRIANIEERLATGNFATAETVDSAANRSEPKPKDDTTSNIKPNVDSMTAISGWTEALEEMGRKDPFSSGTLTPSRAFKQGDKVVVKTSNHFAINLFAKQENRALIATALNLIGEANGITPDKIIIEIDQTVKEDEDPLSEF